MSSSCSCAGLMTAVFVACASPVALAALQTTADDTQPSGPVVHAVLTSPPSDAELITAADSMFAATAASQPGGVAQRRQ